MATSTHLLSLVDVLLLEKSASRVRKKDTLCRFAKRMPRKTHKLTQWPSRRESGCTYQVHIFGSVELGSVSDNRKTTKSKIIIKNAGREVQIKADRGAEATVIPYYLYKEITREAFTEDPPTIERMACNETHKSSGLCISSDSVQETKTGSCVPCCGRQFHTTSWL